MNISPLDIRKHEFRKTLRGFDPDEVSTFLDMVSVEAETLIRENARLNEKLAGLDEQLKKYRDIESTLQETLLSAQRAQEETIKTAKKQAEVIIKEAEVRAASIVEDGRVELSRLRSVCSELKVHKDAFLAKLRALVDSQRRLLEEITFPEENKIDAFEMPAPESSGQKRGFSPGKSEAFSLNQLENEEESTEENLFDNLDRDSGE